MLFFGLSIKIAYAQDPTFSQFYNNPLYFNPGFTGMHPGINFYCIQRTQWLKVASQYKGTGQFNTSCIAIDINNDDCWGGLLNGIGLILIDDVEGEGNLETQTAGISIAQKVHLDKYDKTPCIQLGFQICSVQKKIKWDRLVFSDQINSLNTNIIPTGNTPPNEFKKGYGDLNIGVAGTFGAKLIDWKKKKDVWGIFTWGVSLSHVL